jgi:hypothetical protein
MNGWSNSFHGTLEPTMRERTLTMRFWSNAFDGTLEPTMRERGL